MIAQLDNYLSATQLGVTVASLGLGWIGEPAFAGLVGAVIGLPGWWSHTTSHALSATVRARTHLAVVMDQGRPIGLITMEDILEEIVGRIEDEYPRQPKVFLKDALAGGGVALDLAVQTPEVRCRRHGVPPRSSRANCSAARMSPK